MHQIITVFQTGGQDQTKVKVKFNTIQINGRCVPHLAFIHAKNMLRY